MIYRMVCFLFGHAPDSECEWDEEIRCLRCGAVVHPAVTPELAHDIDEFVREFLDDGDAA